eukprot:3931871-Rhodomonas_salina.3
MQRSEVVRDGGRKGGRGRGRERGRERGKEGGYGRGKYQKTIAVVNMVGDAIFDLDSLAVHTVMVPLALVGVAVLEPELTLAVEGVGRPLARVPPP